MWPTELEEKKEQAEGVMSFSEIAEYAPRIGSFVLHSIVNLARKGTTPAANTIQIPLEKDWPEWAVCVQLFYIPNNHSHAMELIDGVTRRKPQWVPTETDIVLFWDDHHDDDYCPQDAMLYRRRADNCDHYAKIEELSDIGKSIGWFKENREWK